MYRSLRRNMQVHYVDHMGSDTLVVDAARVSFDKNSEEFTEDRNNRLIRYLSDHSHWAPFAHPQVCLKFEAPIFIARQAAKHQVGFIWNEVSRRYVDDFPTFFYPETWRGAPTNGAKQGSSDPLPQRQRDEAYENYEDLLSMAQTVYAELLDLGVAPEQARMVLPQSMYTSWYWTGSLAAWARFVKQRTDPHSQKEIQELAKMTNDIIQPLFPVSWEALVEGSTGKV